MVTAIKQDSTGKHALIDGLNQDLAGEYQAMISYIQYAAVVSGPYRPQLVQFFLAEVADEQRHAEYLANKIAALGGDPTVTPKDVPTSRDTREMLEFIRQAEAETIENYRQRIDQAEAAGEIGLKVQLEEFVSDETSHKEEVEKILADWR
ncbi:MAG: ferritin-like domain-containing protein [Thermomicrobiales bacterium]